MELVFNNLALELIKMCGEEVHNLKIYESENIDDLMARSSELDATDVGKEETVNLSISNIAHGSSVKSKCC